MMQQLEIRMHIGDRHYPRSEIAQLNNQKEIHTKEVNNGERVGIRMDRN